MSNRFKSSLLRFVCLMIVIGSCSLSTSGKCVNKRYYVERYGNDKQAFEKLANDVNANGGGKIIFPKDMIYEISIEDDDNGGHGGFPQESSILFFFENCKKLFVNMNGARIIVKNNHSSRYAVFLLYNCKSFTVENGFLEGDAKGHDYSPVYYRGEERKSSHEWGHGIDVTGSKGVVRNMSISYMTGDGIRISSFNSKTDVSHAKVDVDNCEICYCRRNGVTMGSSEGITLSNTTIHHIGTHNGITGALPQAGVDIEYEDKVGDTGAITIHNCQFYECTTSTITASNTSVPNPCRFVIEHSKIEGSYFQITNLKVQEGRDKLVKGCHFVNTPINCGNAVVEDCFFEMGTQIHYINGTTFRGCTFNGQLDTKDSKYGCCFGGNNYSPATFTKCKFQNVRGKNDRSHLQGFSGYSFKIEAYFNNCEFINSTFAQGGAGAESNYTFVNCTLEEGCGIHNRSDNLVTFKKSKLNNVASYMNQKGQFSFDQCEIIQDDPRVEYPLLYFGNHRMRACTVSNKIAITPTMKKLGVKKALIEIID